MHGRISGVLEPHLMTAVRRDSMILLETSSRVFKFHQTTLAMIISSILRRRKLSSLGILKYHNSHLIRMFLTSNYLSQLRTLTNTVIALNYCYQERSHHSSLDILVLVNRLSFQTVWLSSKKRRILCQYSSISPLRLHLQEPNSP